MIVGGLSWRWLGYLILIAGGTVFCSGSILISETHAPTLLRRRAVKRVEDPNEKQRLRKELKPRADPRTIVVIYLTRPFSKKF